MVALRVCKDLIGFEEVLIAAIALLAARSPRRGKFPQ
jgi:hypothetical protein